MKQVKFLSEIGGVISVVLILGFAKVTYPNTHHPGDVEGPVVTRSMPAQKITEADQPAASIQGLINSKFIIVNY